MRKTILLLLLSSAVHCAMAQDSEDEFQRIAKRIMDSHDHSDTAFGTDSIASLWHGGAYMGASSQGRVMPSGHFTFKSGKIVLTGDMAADIVEKITGEEETTDYAVSRTVVDNDITTRAEDIQSSIRLDYYPRQTDCFTIGMLENYKHRLISEDALIVDYDQNDEMANSAMKTQDKTTDDMKLGLLMQWKHLFEDKSLLMARANVRYFYKNVDIGMGRWDASQLITGNALETTKEIKPYAQLQYTSKKWGAFSFSAMEKMVYGSMKVDELHSHFSYDNINNIVDATLKYTTKEWNISANASYEYFHSIIDGTRNSHNDVLAKIKAGWKVSSCHYLALDYKSTIRRPTYTQLYFHRHLGSTIGAYYIGNRYLQPSLNRQYKMSYIFSPKDLSITLGVMYEDIRRDITKISGRDEYGESYKTWVNDATYNNLNFTMDGKWVAGVLDLRWHLKVKHLQYSGNLVDDDKAWSWSLKVRPEVTLGNGWKLAATMFYQGREQHYTYYNKSYSYFSVRAVKDFGNWSLYGFIQDIAEQDKVEVTYGKLNSVTTREDNNSRTAIIGCSYTF